MRTAVTSETFVELEKEWQEEIIHLHFATLDKPRGPASRPAFCGTDLREAEGRMKAVEIGMDILQRYVGEYGERKLTLEEGVLFYQRTGPKYRLVPLTPQLFAVEGLDYFRIEIVTDRDGKATEIIGLYDHGLRDPSPRTK